MSAPLISVVIRCCNEEQHIGRLLAGILEQSVREVEVILVDSGSTDATLAIASRYPVDVRHIRREEFSFGRSLNVGCAAARGEFIVIASAHVYPLYRDWLAKLIEPFADPATALVYGKQRGDERTKYAEHRLFASLFPERATAPDAGYFCNNANSAIRRALWQRLPYDETLTGLEDLAWARQVVEQGHRVRYQPEATVIHVHEERWRQVMNRYRREAIALRRIAPEEHFGLGDFLRCCGANVFADLRHAAREGRLAEVWRGVVAFRVMQFWGTYVGYRQAGAPSATLKRTFYYPAGGDHHVEPQGGDGRPDLRINYAALPRDDEPA